MMVRMIMARMMMVMVMIVEQHDFGGVENNVVKIGCTGALVNCT